MKIMFYFLLRIKLELCNKIRVVESTCIANLCLGIFNDNLHSWFYDTWVSTSFCAFTSSITPLNDSTLTYREKWSLLYLILLFCKYTYWYVHVNLSWSIKHAKKKLANIQPSWPNTWSITYINHSWEVTLAVGRCLSSDHCCHGQVARM